MDTPDCSPYCQQRGGPSPTATEVHEECCKNAMAVRKSALRLDRVFELGGGLAERRSDGIDMVR